MSGTIVDLVVILILVLLNGVFVAAEIALITIRRSRVEQLVVRLRRLQPLGLHEVLADEERRDHRVAWHGVELAVDLRRPLGVGEKPPLALASSVATFDTSRRAGR